MAQLREFLRHQYIGAIVIGLLGYQGVITLVSVLSGIVLFYANPGTRSVLGYEKPSFPWDRMLPNFLQAVLALALAYVLLLWLYRSKTVAAPEPAESAE